MSSPWGELAPVGRLRGDCTNNVILNTSLVGENVFLMNHFELNL